MKKNPQNFKYEYKLVFEFTTVHRGGKFVGRSGECTFFTNHFWENVDLEHPGLIGVCRHAVMELKPTYQVFMITIKAMSLVEKEIKPKRSRKTIKQ